MGFGVAAYFASRHVHEIGIRLALGAMRRDALKMVLSRGLGLAAAGIGLGLAGPLAVTRFLGSLHEGIPAPDPVGWALATLIFALVAAAAGLIPSPQASRVDPAVVLRYE